MNGERTTVILSPFLFAKNKCMYTVLVLYMVSLHDGGNELKYTVHILNKIYTLILIKIPE